MQRRTIMLETLENRKQKENIAEDTKDKKPKTLDELFKGYKGETKQPEYWKDVKPVGKEEI